MMKIICIVLLLLYGVTMLIMCCYALFKKSENKVHFYVARDNDGELYLYFGKPIRCGNKFMITSTSNTIFLGNKIENYGLNPCDYDNLKWENEPVEVFLNLKD